MKPCQSIIPKVLFMSDDDECFRAMFTRSNSFEARMEKVRRVYEDLWCARKEMIYA